MKINLKNQSFILLAFLAALITMMSCNKNLDNNPVNEGPLPDLLTKIPATVKGFVVNENNAPVEGAQVTAGGLSTTTDQYGYFIIPDAQLVKSAAVVAVEKSGYFKAIKTFIAEDGKSAFFRIKLLPKTIAGTFTASAGGNVSMPGGMALSFPSNAVVNASTGSSYAGNVNVAMAWINPMAQDISQTMPGDLRGINEAGYLRLLTTYGMAAVEMTGSAGELLQLANGSKATMTFPLPAAMAANAPASIPLWYFDEQKGLWKQEGSATKNGNNYVGQVSHFSYWNCDVPNTYVRFNCTVVDSLGQPISHAFVKVSVVSNPNSAGYGYTDSAGYTGGAVPDNAQLLLEIFSDASCGTPAYSQTFTTTNTNISLGTIMVNNTTYTASVSGNVTNCTGLPVTSGFLIMKQGQRYYRYPVSSTGTVSFNVLMCNSSSPVEFIAEDYSAGQQSSPVADTLVSGNNNIGSIQACGNAIDEFMYMNINGTQYAFTLPADTIYQYPYLQANYYKIYAYSRQNSGTTNYRYTWIRFDTTGCAQGSAQQLVNLTTSMVSDSLNPANPPIYVNLTEFGAPLTGYMAGYFSGNFLGSGGVNSYAITGSFRVKRRF